MRILEEPEVGTVYWVAFPANPQEPIECVWEDTYEDYRELECGFIYTSEEEAIAAGEVERIIRAEMNEEGATAVRELISRYRARYKLFTAGGYAEEFRKSMTALNTTLNLLFVDGTPSPVSVNTEMLQENFKGLVKVFRNLEKGGTDTTFPVIESLVATIGQLILLCESLGGHFEAELNKFLEKHPVYSAEAILKFLEKQLMGGSNK